MPALKFRFVNCVLQVNYPSQEELLNDVASLMQQMRRFKIDCEAKSDPKTEGKQVEKWISIYPICPICCCQTPNAND